MDPDFQEFLNSLPIKGGARTRIINCLWAANITSFDRLLSKGDFDLLRLPYMSRVFVLILTTALAKRIDKGGKNPPTSQVQQRPPAPAPLRPSTSQRGLSLAVNSLVRRAQRCPTCGQILRDALAEGETT
jgi:hypothetical protein